jgi:hypothetical protein
LNQSGFNAGLSLSKILPSSRFQKRPSRLRDRIEFWRCPEAPK